MAVGGVCVFDVCVFVYLCVYVFVIMRDRRHMCLSLCITHASKCKHTHMDNGMHEAILFCLLIISSCKSECHQHVMK